MTAPVGTFEHFLTAPELGDFPASPLQLALARAADARPLAGILTDQECHQHFGCSPELLGQTRPTLVLECGGRATAKSTRAGLRAVHQALTTNVRGLRSSEVPRVVVVAPTTDAAGPTFEAALEVVQRAPSLRRLIVGKPTADTIRLRRPDRRTVELVIGAATRGALAVRARWLAGVVLDEAGGFEAGLLAELVRAASPRLLPSGQILIVGSPVEESGDFFEVFARHFGAPTSTLVARVPTLAANPGFSREVVDAMRERDPVGARREFDAEFSTGSDAFFDGQQVDASVRVLPLEIPPSEAGAVAWACDPGFTTNAWTLIGCDSSGDPGAERIRVAVAREWRGTRAAPLSADRVLSEISAIMSRYASRHLQTDATAGQALVDLSRRHDLDLVIHRLDTSDISRLYSKARELVATKRLELSPHSQLAADLKRVRQRVTGGVARIDLPRTVDGRHCDFCPALVLAVAEAPNAPRRASAPTTTPTRVVRPIQTHSSGLEFLGSSGVASSTTDRVIASLDQRMAREGAVPAEEYSATRDSLTDELARSFPHITSRGIEQ